MSNDKEKVLQFKGPEVFRFANLKKTLGVITFFSKNQEYLYLVFADEDKQSYLYRSENPPDDSFYSYDCHSDPWFKQREYTKIFWSNIDTLDEALAKFKERYIVVTTSKEFYE